MQCIEKIMDFFLLIIIFFLFLSSLNLLKLCLSFHFIYYFNKAMLNKITFSVPLLLTLITSSKVF